jgi:hypothetical protein
MGMIRRSDLKCFIFSLSRFEAVKKPTSNPVYEWLNFCRPVATIRRTSASLSSSSNRFRQSAPSFNSLSSVVLIIAGLKAVLSSALIACANTASSDA